MAAIKSLPVHRYKCTFVISHFLVLWGCKVQHLVFESRVALNSGLGGVRNVASVVITHERDKVKCELRVASRELRVASRELRVG